MLLLLLICSLCGLVLASSELEQVQREKLCIKWGPRYSFTCAQCCGGLCNYTVQFAQSAEKAKFTKQKPSRSWEVQPHREARCCHCSSAINWLEERGFWVDSQPCASLVCHCKLCLCCPWQPTLQVGDGRQDVPVSGSITMKGCRAGKTGNSLPHSFTCTAPVVILYIWMRSVSLAKSSTDHRHGESSGRSELSMHFKDAVVSESCRTQRGAESVSFYLSRLRRQSSR